MPNETPADEQAIREIDAAWSRALHNKDLDQVISNYAEDASFLPPDEPIVVGRTKIREWFAKRVSLPGYSATFAPTTVRVAKSRDIAYELGTFRVSINDPAGKPVIHVGKHLVTWEKRDGGWKVTAESINSDSPPVDRSRWSVAEAPFRTRASAVLSAADASADTAKPTQGE